MIKLLITFDSESCGTDETGQGNKPIPDIGCKKDSFVGTIREYAAAGFLVLTTFLCLNGEWAWAQSSDSYLRVSKGSITAELHQVPLRSVLQKLREQLGLKYVVPLNQANRPITDDFTSIPLSTALSRMFAHVDHFFKVDTNGMPIQVVIAVQSEPSPDVSPQPKHPLEAKSIVSTPKQLIGIAGTNLNQTELAMQTPSTGETYAISQEYRSKGMEITHKTGTFPNIPIPTAKNTMIVESAKGMDMEVTLQGKQESLF